MPIAGAGAATGFAPGVAGTGAACVAGFGGVALLVGSFFVASAGNIRTAGLGAVAGGSVLTCGGAMV